MLKRQYIYVFMALVAMAGAVNAAEIGGGSSASSSSSGGTTGKTDYDTIQIMHEYNQRMVGMIENYMRDRAKIPADYQAAADKEFLRRAKLEKMGVKKAMPEKKAETKKK